MPPKNRENRNKLTPKPPTAKDITNREYFSGDPTDTSNYSLSSSPEVPATPPQTSPKGIRSSSAGSVVNISKSKETEEEEKDQEQEKKEDKKGKTKSKGKAKQRYKAPQKYSASGELLGPTPEDMIAEADPRDREALGELNGSLLVEGQISEVRRERLGDLQMELREARGEEEDSDEEQGDGEELGKGKGKKK
ncbi:hypothetical protein P171DRAFT_518958 [Karstenula rhodostoma CBS 690.94]|uniref:Uncharacterized protein n=1 Tax=Karstenula rhodostoma CBS 690.94 TaxID=1392251 RepID=A0A9P4PS27_9PLEO|nr:hypothetical protein P171DRAFT_518958 [Karstenula rhodostoma CBS 690.94]